MVDAAQDLNRGLDLKWLRETITRLKVCKEKGLL